MAMIKILALAAGLAGGLILNGCVATQQIVPFPDQSRIVEDMGKGRIYVIGDPLFYNLASHNYHFSVVENDRLKGYITGHGFICWEREAGVAKIIALSEEAELMWKYPKSRSTLEINIESGKAYYILMHIGPAWETVNLALPGSGQMSVKLEVVNEEYGKKVLSESQPPQLN